MTKDAPRKRGRPTRYSEAQAEAICRRLYESEGDAIPESLRQVCADPEMPGLATVSRWLHEKPEFRERYARARELRREALVDRLMAISRRARESASGAPGTGEAGARVQAIKLEIDTLKWILSKEYARDYGDRVNLEHSGPDGGPVKTEAAYRLTPEDEAMVKRISEVKGRLEAEGEGRDECEVPSDQ